MGRIVGIDYGRKRIGLAVTDPLNIIANPLTTLNPAEFEAFMKRYMETEVVDCFVVGYPRQLDNSPSESVKDLIPFLTRIKRVFPEIPVYKVDERFTSVIAQRAIIDGGIKKEARKEKGLVDKVSATLILQSYLENSSVKNRPY
jgi:putative Holliday junction resolvase